MLGIPSNSELSRIDVTRLLINFIKLNRLAQGRKITVDNRLATVLGNEHYRLAISQEHRDWRTGAQRPPSADVTYFNLQLFLSHNFSLTPFVPPLPKIAPAQRQVNEELQLIVFDRPADSQARSGSLQALGGPRFQELQKLVAATYAV